MAEEHDCIFPEVELLADDEDVEGNLKAGMRVLTPCSCGETPLDHLSIIEGYLEEATRALHDIDPGRSLFHWAPSVRRKQITRYGLRPRMRSTTSGFLAPYTCFADSPSWAWALSGNMSYTPPGSWDLWQTGLDRLTEPIILPGEDRPSGIYEVRTEHRLYKRDLWYVASRVK